MVLEVAQLQVKAGQDVAFEAAFGEASAIIASMAGYRGHELQRCVEVHNRYVLLVRWERIEDHDPGFRTSAGYQRWKDLLHHFYEPGTVVEHFVKVYP